MENLSIKSVIEMFNIFPDILFWVKDAQGCFIYGNGNFLTHMGVKHLNQVIGYSDFDFSPAHIAEQFKIDDNKVMAGEVVNERLEMNISVDNEISWFSTSKRVLLDENKTPIGTYGVSRQLEKTSIAQAGIDALKIPVTYVHNNYMNEITLKTLANISHLSISALERRFKKYLNKTPNQFIKSVRLENARRLLVETNFPIATIANNTGYSDNSYFSRQFHQLFGKLPSEFRKIHSNVNNKY